MNATVSGLVSRSVYDKNGAGPDDFHGCLYYGQLEQHDLSNYFIDAILDRVDIIWQKVLPQHQNPIELNFQKLQTISQQFLQWISECYGMTHHNYIKPGIGEATRVLLRREARLLRLQDLDSDATRHLR